MDRSDPDDKATPNDQNSGSWSTELPLPQETRDNSWPYPETGAQSTLETARPFADRLEQAVKEEMFQRPGGGNADTWDLVDLKGPTRMSDNRDDNLGPNQQRYYGTFSEYTGERYNISVNYDPDTDQFGTIKFSSRQPG